jgi:cytoskeletal protein RodZ
MSRQRSIAKLQRTESSRIAQLEAMALKARHITFRLLGVAALLLLVVTTVSSIAGIGKSSDDHEAKTSSQHLTHEEKESTMTQPQSNNNANSSSHSVSSQVTTRTVNGHTETNVTINGQPVEVPDNGTVNRTVTNDDGVQTQVNISNNTQSDASNTSSSFSSINVMTQQFQQNSQ